MLEIHCTFKIKPGDLQWFNKETQLYDVDILHEQEHSDGCVYVYCKIPSFTLAKALFEKLDSEQRNIVLLV